MKTALVVTLLLALALPSFAELTRQDVEQIIRQALEPIKQEITAIKLDIAEMRGEIKAVRAEMKALEGKMATKDDIIILQRTLTIALVTAWITIIAAIITIPYLYGRADRKKIQELEARLREDERRIERMQAESDTLKSLRETAMRLAQENPEYAEGFRRLGVI
jgi:predicted nuclease with TOPRIM domain